MFTPGGAWIVPYSRPTAKVRALIFVSVVQVDVEARGTDSWVASVFALLASCKPA